MNIKRKYCWYIGAKERLAYNAVSEKNNLRGRADMILEDLFEKFYKELNAETYRSKVEALKEFVIVKEKVNDRIYAAYFEG